MQGFTLNAGSATGTTNALPGGSNYTVVAKYAGDGTFGSSASSPPVTVNVAPESSRVQIAYELFDPITGGLTNPNATNLTFGTPSLLRVSVTSAAGDACSHNAPGDSGCPTGNILLMDNLSTLGPNGGNFPLNALGYAEDAAIDLPGGVHNLAATYGGDNGFSVPSTNPTTETVTINPAATTTGVAASASQITLGDTLFLTATVKAENIFSTIFPTSTVTFYSGTTPIATAGGGDIVGNPTTHEMTFITFTSTNSLSPGQNTITGHYNGDPSYQVSTSAPVTVSALYATSTAVSTSNSSVQHGTNVTFTARVTTSQAGAPAITGTVLFAADSVALGPPVALSNGQAQIVTSTLAGGTHTITAEYQGDSNFAISVGSATETVVLIGTMTSVSSSSSTITQGQNVTFTATMTPAQGGGPVLAGTVQFTSNGSNIGAAAVVSNGQSQVQTTTLPPGPDQITAIYSGDGNYSGSTSSSITETVNPAPTFTVTANPTTVPVPSPGQTGSTTLTFTSQNGFTSNGAVTITPVCSGLPNGSLCSSGASVTIPANGTATAMLTFSTMAPSSLAPRSRYTSPNFDRRTPLEIITLACMFCWLMLALAARKIWIRSAILLVIACGLLVAASGCGGGGSGGSGGGGGGGGGGNPGTLPGQYNITVTVTINGVTANAPIMLNVQ